LKRVNKPEILQEYETERIMMLIEGQPDTSNTLAECEPRHYTQGGAQPRAHTTILTLTPSTKGLPNEKNTIFTEPFGTPPKNVAICKPHRRVGVLQFFGSFHATRKWWLSQRIWLFGYRG